MANERLPTGFEDLEALTGAWALLTQNERSKKRRSSSMEEVRAFYDAVLPRTEAIIEYLNQFSLDRIPEEARPLLHLAFSLAEVAPFVEIYGDLRVPDSFEETRFVAVHGDRVD